MNYKINKNKIIFLLKWHERADGDLLSDMYVFNPKEKLVRSDAELRGRIWWGFEKEKLRPFRFEKFQKNTSYFQDLDEAIQLLKKASAIAVPPDDLPPCLPEFMEFISKFKIKTPKKIAICPNCFLERKKLTIIKSNEYYKSYQEQVCKHCAEKEVRESYQKKGLEITKFTRAYYLKKLNATKNVKDSVSVLDTGSGIFGLEGSFFDLVEADEKSDSILVNRFLTAHPEIKEIKKSWVKFWASIGINKFLPVQQKALEADLLRYQDQLIVAGTSSGKTLVGEIAGLNNLKNRKSKFVFLVPLVALCNQKYQKFDKDYSKIGYKVGIRVGVSRIQLGGNKKTKMNTSLKHSDIIVGTYEAFDWVLRSGRHSEIGKLGVIVIDELQLLGDRDRGQQLDGLIARIRLLFPKCQIIGLSATIGNPEELARDLGLRLIQYEERPVPVERHLVITEKPIEKEKIIARLVKEDSKKKSPSGYFGKSLVFTNTRRQSQHLSTFLDSTGISSNYYHAGLTYPVRKRIEENFLKGRYDVIVTTSALGAGVDFPVSQVIFENPGMGARWLTVAEFYQMLGRAGRFGYHNLGKAYLMVANKAKIHSGMNYSEEQVGFSLLTQEIEKIDLEIIEDLEFDQVLSFISAVKLANVELITNYYNKLYYTTEQLESILSSLFKKGLIIKKGNNYLITKLGRSLSSSFLTPNIGYKYAKELLKDDFQKIAIRMNYFENIYLSPEAHGELEQTTKAKMSTRLFNDGIVDAIITGSTKGKWTKSFSNKVKIWLDTLFSCGCRSIPYCNHPATKISEILRDYRINGLNPNQISNQIKIEYNLTAYPGDVYSWLDSHIHSLEAVKRIASVMEKDEIVNKSTLLINKMFKTSKAKKNKNKSKPK